MAQGHGNPVVRRLTLALPAGSDPVAPETATGSPASPATGPATGSGVASPASALPVAMTLPERAGTAARYWSAELWLGPGRIIHEIAHAEPDTRTAHRAYVKSRAWVPAELKGHPSGDAIGSLGMTYHRAAAPLRGFLFAVESGARKTRWALDRPQRALSLFAFLVITVLILVICL